MRGRPAAAARGGVLSLFPRRRFGLLAFGVRARDGGAIGILSITHKQTDKNGLGHVEGSKTSRAAALEVFFPNYRPTETRTRDLGLTIVLFELWPRW